MHLPQPVTYLPGHDGRRIAVYRREPQPSGAVSHPVLYVHGGTFPAPLAVGFPFDGRSWMDDLAEAGFDVWAFDFLGFGASSRYPGAVAGEPALPPQGRAVETADQVEAVARHVLARTGGSRLSLIAHSWGTQPASRFAARYPEWVERHVLFAPIVARNLPGMPDPDGLPPTKLLTPEEQWKRFVEDVPAGAQGGMLLRHFTEWTAAYVASDPDASGRTPPAVCIPTGPQADIIASWSGKVPYDPAAVRTRTLLVRSAWDRLCTDADAGWLRDARGHGGDMQDISIAGATHLMHLESARSELYRAVRKFLAEHRP